MGVDLDQDLIGEVDAELANFHETHENNPTPKSENKDASRSEILRDTIAIQMWTNYQNDLLV